MRWDAPAHMLLAVGITPVGRPREEGIWVYGTDILTPRDDCNTYFFWGVPAPNGHDGPQVLEQWAQAIDGAFAGQDKPMIEAPQALIRQRGGNDIEDVESVLLTTDAGPTRCRRVLRQLLAAEGRQVVPTPRNPDLRQRLATNGCGRWPEPVV